MLVNGAVLNGTVLGAVAVAPLLGATVLGTTLLGADVAIIGAGVGPIGADVGSTVAGPSGVVVGLVVEFEEIGANVGILSTFLIIVLQKNVSASSLLTSSPTFSRSATDEPAPKVKATRNALVIKNCMVNCYL